MSVETSPSRHVLKAMRRNPKEKTQRGQYLLAVGLETLQMVSESDTGRCVNEEAEP